MSSEDVREVGSVLDALKCDTAGEYIIDLDERNCFYGMVDCLQLDLTWRGECKG